MFGHWTRKFSCGAVDVDAKVRQEEEDLGDVLAQYPEGGYWSLEAGVRLRTLRALAQLTTLLRLPTSGFEFRSHAAKLVCSCAG
jgi:hypothetical protein